MNTIDFQDRNFSVLEAAQHLRVSRAYIFKLLKEKRLRPVKLGTRTILTGAELKRFVEASSTQA